MELFGVWMGNTIGLALNAIAFFYYIFYKADWAL